MAISFKNTFLSFEAREEACSPGASRRTRSYDATEVRSSNGPSMDDHLEALNQLLEGTEAVGSLVSGLRKASSSSSISTMASEETQSLRKAMSITSMSSLPSWADCVDSDEEDVQFDMVIEAEPEVRVDRAKALGRTPVRRSGGPAGSACRAQVRGGLSFPAAVARPVKATGAPVGRAGPVMTTVSEEQAPHIAKCDLPLVVPSLGSVGHAAGACAGPCKYFAKSRGCKDGTQCSHCHLCTWSCKLYSKERRLRAKTQRCGECLPSAQ